LESVSTQEVIPLDIEPTMTHVARSFIMTVAC